MLLHGMLKKSNRFLCIGIKSEGGATSFGVAIDENIETASVKALVNALSRMRA